MVWSKVSVRRKAEVLGLLLVTVSLFVLLSLITHSFDDDRWFAAEQDETWTGRLSGGKFRGAVRRVVAFVLVGALGISSLGLVGLGILFGLRQLFDCQSTVLIRQVFVIFAVVFTAGVLVNLRSAGAGPYLIIIRCLFPAASATLFRLAGRLAGHVGRGNRPGLPVGRNGVSVRPLEKISRR